MARRRKRRRPGGNPRRAPQDARRPRHACGGARRNQRPQGGGLRLQRADARDKVERRRAEEDLQVCSRRAWREVAAVHRPLGEHFDAAVGQISLRRSRRVARRRRHGARLGSQHRRGAFVRDVRARRAMPLREPLRRPRRGRAKRRRLSLRLLRDEGDASRQHHGTRLERASRKPRRAGVRGESGM